MRQLIISALLAMPLCACAEVAADTLSVADMDYIINRIERYEKRIERRQRFWDSLIPDFARLQFYGSTGLVNAGVGWAYGKHDQWETDVMLGFVPKYEKEDAFLTFTIRQTYVPWTKGLWRMGNKESLTKPYLTFQPLSCGMYVNTVLRSDYWQSEPNKYPEGGYYRFATKLRFGVFIGQRYTLHIPPSRRFLAKDISFVWELSSCDLYIVSKAVNRYIPLKDVLSLSLGLKYDF